MKILAFAASNSSASINRRLVEHAAEIVLAEIRPDAEVEFIDLNDFEMPLYSADREKAGGVPELAHRFRDKIGAADALLISFAEHNGSYTVAFKNVYDWASRIDMKVYQGKPMVVLSTSPGKGGGGNVLKTVLSAAPFFGGEVIGSLSVPQFGQSFDAAAGKLRDPALAASLREALAPFANVATGAR